MILEEATFEQFGYYPKDLTPQSGKKILASCNGCGKIREISKNIYHDLCKSCAVNGERNPFYGRYHSEETKQKIRIAKKGKHHTDEARQNMSKAKQNMSEETKLKMSKAKLNMSEETKRKMCDARKGKYYGEKSPSWKGGVSYDPYCIKFNFDFKERVRNYFGRCCYVCDKNEIDNKAKLSVHHVNYNKDTCCDDSKPLFVPLCHKCHSKTNHDREFWQEFFTASLEFLTDGECYIRK